MCVRPVRPSAGRDRPSTETQAAVNAEVQRMMDHMIKTMAMTNNVGPDHHNYDHNMCLSVMSVSFILVTCDFLLALFALRTGVV